MSSFRKRIEKIETGIMERSGLAQLDFSQMTSEELQEIIVMTTREILRQRLHRAPTEEELAAQLEADRAYFESLSNQELVRLARNFERTRAHRARIHG